jgi:FAD/FMN-containing dehydrogenase
VKDALAFNLPDFLGVITTQAYTENQHKAQCEAIKDICKEFNIEILPSDIQIRAFPENMRGTMEHILPSTGGQLPFQFWTCWDFSRGGGGQWVGSYVSTRNILKYYKLSREVCIKYGKPPQFYSRIMFGGHYCVARTNVTFNKNDPEDIKITRKILKEIHNAVQSLDGVIMYKPPLWAVQTYRDKMLPATRDLIEKVKKLLDPNNIMNPGQGIGED